MPRNRSEKSEPPVADASGTKRWYRDGKLEFFQPSFSLKEEQP